MSKEPAPTSGKLKPTKKPVFVEDPGSSTKTGFFVGLSFPEVGAGSLDIGMGTSANYASSETEYYTYEASYSYPINDGMTITPGVYIKEGTTDETGVAVKTSFSF